MKQQLPLPTSSLPIDPLSVASNYFSLYCLEFSVQLLREHHPVLALTIQNLTALARLNQLNNSEYHSKYNSKYKLLELDLDIQLVSNIVAALSNIAEQAAKNNEQDKENTVAIHQTLLDWLLYAQRFLNESNSFTLIEGKSNA